ncbi:MAG: histidine kinase [Firmicutes bacterium]|nr:histidine kinase [Bacillota bacterium]
MTHKERIAFWLYFLIPLAGMFVQVFVYGIYIVIAGLVVSAVIMYIFILSDQQEQTYLQRQANEELKVEIMLSQIQPHFLYNCLAVIREICLNDGKQGAAAIDEFTEYLRHNMDSIQKTSPIPFEEELNHTKRYLQLQQLRFGQELNVAYDIRCTDFRIPSLTLQPLVENAVRYGVRKKEEGDGHVLITARECEDHYEISVTDDGPGFDPRMISEDGGQHVGLLNVRQRLQATVGGELVIDSVIGQGATVTMILPKEV